jgi:hypothetical protein
MIKKCASHRTAGPASPFCDEAGGHDRCGQALELTMNACYASDVTDDE